MTFLEARNTIIKRLEEHLGIPVVLSDQATPVPDFPFCYYSATTPYAPTGEMGDHTTREVAANGDTNIVDTRREMPTATLSLVFCSENRWVTQDGEQVFIYGEDEAQQYASMAQGWFLHVAYDTLSNLGIVVVDVMNATNRTALVVDEAARRYGFDLRFRYTRTDERTDATVSRVSYPGTTE
ncbi:MAG: hypothetical protein LBD02_01715 [Christensenellaceae bacterium]|jgi:hypothetical protein|nr:hypothetical protein [Christensenellaceae bacterium]